MLQVLWAGPLFSLVKWQWSRTLSDSISLSQTLKILVFL